MYTNNIGRTDTGIRLMIGVVLLATTVLFPGTYWGLLGFIPIATALFGFCPLYRLLGISTCEAPEQA